MSPYFRVLRALAFVALAAAWTFSIVGSVVRYRATGHVGWGRALDLLPYTLFIPFILYLVSRDVGGGGEGQ